MKIIDPQYTILSPYDSEWPEISIEIERIGRTCYQSVSGFTKATANRFIRRLIESGHESVLEHASMSVKIVCDRGVSHELVRHRLATFSQESTRYCNYGVTEEQKDGLALIRPFFFKEGSDEYAHWYHACGAAEIAYDKLLDLGATPQEARSVLPNSLKTEIVITANMREWRHIFRLRTSKAAHPQMREIMVPLLKQCQNLCPPFFSDIQNAVEAAGGATL